MRKLYGWLQGAQRGMVAALVTVGVLGVGVSLAWASTSVPRTERPAQGISPTPVQLQFPTHTPTPGPPTATPSRTPTPIGRPWVEALGEVANVRAEPDINGARVGQIRQGITYPILGQRYQWYWIEYPEIPAGTAWVHESVVKVGGDTTQIVQLEELPTVEPALAAAQATALAISATPGMGLTLTAQAQITPTGAFTAQPGDGDAALDGQPLPTFTFPPYTVTPLIIPRQNPPPTTSGALPPVVPIMALGALGLLGLLVATLRRL